MERLGDPIYRRILERVGVGPGTKLLDVGCGAGRFCRIAADRGAHVAGIDAAAALVGIARERIPDGDLRVGDMERLPWQDDSFDVVTGFNSFFFAADMARALREARRVARPGASVAITVFGRPERCESTPVFASLGQLLPSQSAAKGVPPSTRRVSSRRSCPRPGSRPGKAAYVEIPEEDPDLDTLLRGYLAVGPVARAVRALGERAVRDVFTEALRPFRTSRAAYA